MPSRGRLSEQQVALAQAFFRNQPEGFFLTGGAVLAGWELEHRATDDLDLFTVNATDMALGEQALRRAADELGASLEAISTSPDFRRFVARFPGESVKVDLVRDHAPQLFPKVERDGVRMDSAEEIFVNKICTLVERSEPRDLVDLMLLERRGLRVETSLARAQEKDAGVSPATLAWLLRSLPIPPAPPGSVSAEELRAYAVSLEGRLLAIARG
ncbi:MAG: nucleotidyl transferase AbiEii/AbiGii toxin family protein [Myxococcales bacterium]|nr:nucleotidyl transferase AbiEii/AbiGii toxin family protein [Myxococcales bacterium]